MVLGSGIRDPEKTYSGSREKNAPDPGSGTLKMLPDAGNITDGVALTTESRHQNLIVLLDEVQTT